VIVRLKTRLCPSGDHAGSCPAVIRRSTWVVRFHTRTLAPVESLRVKATLVPSGENAGSESPALTKKGVQIPFPSGTLALRFDPLAGWANRGNMPSAIDTVASPKPQARISARRHSITLTLTEGAGRFK
jgi:hypothetical protein